MIFSCRPTVIIGLKYIMPAYLTTISEPFIYFLHYILRNHDLNEVFGVFFVSSYDAKRLPV